jgi:hypothetical protein
MPYEAARNQKTVHFDLIMPGWHRIEFFQVANICLNDVNIYIYRTILIATKMLLPNFKM